MQVERIGNNVDEIAASTNVVGIFQDEPLSESAAVIDGANDGLITRLIAAEDFTGKPFELVPLWSAAGGAAEQVWLAGLGPRKSYDAETAYRVAASVARQLSTKPRGRVMFGLGEDLSAEMATAVICGALVGCEGQDLYRAKRKHTAFNTLLVDTDDAVIRRAQCLGESVNLARRLVDRSPRDLYPQSFVEAAEAAAKEHGLELEVWDESRLASERMGAMLGVAEGSARPPRLVKLSHNGGGKDAPTIALVGKGVTFDSGGLSLKPTDSMIAMKCDMAGAATVLAAMTAIARLGVKANVVGLMGMVENMVAGNCLKLGDVLTARNGKTIEVRNTDAEGRLVLADVLSLAVDLEVDRIVDLATLTGACMVALGTDTAGVMTNNAAWCDEVMAAAGRCGEAAWQLPMFPAFGEQIKSEVADIKNTGNGRWGGAITAAKFLEEFVAEVPWVHIDIAGPSFLDKSTAWSDGGASGAFVRTLVEVVESHVA
ncbi:MAG: leucyl aminopeptidase [Planctomycetales bacterium]|nr:leucyl aminopeptidase [Planctomycetales bacterium]